MSHPQQTVDEIAEECRRLQIKAAKRLRKVATELRKKQKDLNIASVTFNSAGAAASGLGIAGICLAPFTGGLSLGLTAIGGGLGVASGVGGVSTSVAEWKVIRGLVKEADKILNELNTKMGQLSKKLNAELKPMGLSVEKLMVGGGKLAGNIISKLGPGLTKAVSIARVGNNAVRVSVTVGKAAATGGRAAVGGAAKMGSKAGAALGVVGGLVGFGFSVAGIVADSKKIHNDVSPAADNIEKIASALEKEVEET